MIYFIELEVCLMSGVTSVMLLFLQILLNLFNVPVLSNDTFNIVIGGQIRCEYGTLMG
jgi:hypothetical protein